MSYLDEILKKQTTMGCSQEEDICCYCRKSSPDCRPCSLRFSVDSWGETIDYLCPDCRKYLHGQFKYVNCR